jgi:uncharacterized membrane protein YjjP (DUF1212 family)
MPETNDTYKTLDLALRVGELLLSSGAGAADVHAQMRNVAYACGLRGATADVTFTALSMSHQPHPEEPSLIQMRQVRQREIDYEDLTLVDLLVRDLIHGRIGRDEARARMSHIVSSGHARRRWTVTLGYGVMGLGVGLMLGATVVVTLAAFVAAVAIDLIQRQMSRRRLPVFDQQVAGGLFATLLAAGVSAAAPDVGPSRIVTASIILLLAGISFMGAFQDALTGFPLTAGARILEAMLATAGIIAGVSGGLTVAELTGIGLTHLNPGASVFSTLPFMALGGCITAVAFAYSSYAPYRSLPPIGLVAALSTTVYAAAYDGGFGLAWSSAFAAVLVGLLGYPVAGRIRVPTLVLVVSAIVPLLPGLSIFRGLALMTEGSQAGLLSMIQAAAVAIALSSGVILGEYLAQPIAREARRLETRLAGPRLVGPFTARRRLR